MIVLMKKILLLFLSFVLLNVSAQNDCFKVKEDTFKYDSFAIMDDKYDRYDSNDESMALIKISSVNINEAECSMQNEVVTVNGVRDPPEHPAPQRKINISLFIRTDGRTEVRKV